jgi:arylsulfatase A-like enzyme
VLPFSSVLVDRKVWAQYQYHIYHGALRLAHRPLRERDFLNMLGGYTKFIRDGFNDQYLPVWLQDAGYNTYYVGKLMNGHNITNYNSPYPKGWSGTECKCN